MYNPITPAELAAWRALCGKYVDLRHHGVAIPMSEYMQVIKEYRETAHSTFPRLLDEITRLQAEVAIQRAFWGGWHFCAEKKPKSANPHPDKSNEYTSWELGWDIARNTDQLGEAQAECDRLEKRLDGYGHCGICGALLPHDMLRYGVLGDDAGWVCNKCIAMSEMEDQHAGQ